MDTSEVAVLSSTIGDPAGILRFQFKDPLAGRVEEHERVDLNKHPKISGAITFLPMPPEFRVVPGFEAMYSFDLEHKRFYDWCNRRALFTLAYSTDTLAALLTLECLDPEMLTSLAVEMLPSSENAYLARLHGRQACYVHGCRELLCRSANRIAQRVRYEYDSLSDTQDLIDETVLQVAESYSAYLDYISQLMAFRRYADGKHGLGYRHWGSVSKKQTVLFDATDESEAPDTPVW